MWSKGSACSLLLLTMAAVSSGRNARYYFEEARFQHSPSRPEDALVFFIADAPPLICEPEKGEECAGEQPLQADFCLSLPHRYSYYTCSFEGTATADANLNVIRDILPHLYYFRTGWVRGFSENKMYCSTNSQLPDEYFHMRVQRPHEDRHLKCRLLNDNGRLYLRFPGYPTVVCQIGAEAEPFRFNLPGIEDPFTCAFRVYSELRLGDTHTEERLYQSLISSLPSHANGAHPRVACSRHGTSDRPAHFQLLWKGGDTFDCSFPDAAPRYLPEPKHTPQD